MQPVGGTPSSASSPSKELPTAVPPSGPQRLRGTMPMDARRERKQADSAAAAAALAASRAPRGGGECYTATVSARSRESTASLRRRHLRQLLPSAPPAARPSREQAHTRRARARTRPSSPRGAVAHGRDERAVTTR